MKLQKRIPRKKAVLKYMYTDINVTPLTLSVNFEGWMDSWIAHTCGLQTFAPMAAVVRGYEMQFCFHDSKFVSAHATLKKLLLADSLPLDIVIENSLKLGQAIIDIMLRFQDEIPGMESSRISGLFAEVFQKSSKICSYGYIAPLVDFPEPFLSESIERILSGKSAKDDIIFLTQSSLMRPLSLSKQELLKDLSLKRGLDGWLKKWWWVEFGHLGPGYTIQHLDDEYREFINNPEKAKKELARLENEVKSLKSKQDRRFSELGFSAEETSLFVQAQKISFLKAYRTDILYCINAFFDMVLERCSHKLQVSKDALRFCTKNELMRMLSNDFQISESELFQRKQYSVLAVDETSMRFLLGKDADAYLKAYVVPEEQPAAADLKGNVAFPGVVQGKAKILSSIRDVGKVLPGDILVAAQTTPELISAMKKAAAFVTEVGGITCHAAIVARELKKPCIVGVKNATKLLKDGDLIEVDADNGVVTIINS